MAKVYYTKSSRTMFDAGGFVLFISIRVTYFTLATMALKA